MTVTRYKTVTGGDSDIEVTSEKQTVVHTRVKYLARKRNKKKEKGNGKKKDDMDSIYKYKNKMWTRRQDIERVTRDVRRRKNKEITSTWIVKFVFDCVHRSTA